MSKERIRWIVILMAVGLVGLVGFQLYWIQNAIRLQKEQFDYKVTDALQEVVRTLERQEILYLTRQRIQAREQQQRLMAMAKKADKPVVKKVAPKQTESAIARRNPLPATADRMRSLADGSHRSSDVPEIVPPQAVVSPSDALHPILRSTSEEQLLIMEEFIRQQEELSAIGDWRAQIEQQRQFEHWVDQVLMNQLYRLHAQPGTILLIPDSTFQLPESDRRALGQVRKKKPFRKPVAPVRAKEEAVVASSVDAVVPNTTQTAQQKKAGEQSQMIKDVLKGLLLSDRPIEDRVNRFTLDTLLKQALQERGIEIPFSYGVRTKSQPSFLFASYGARPEQFEKRGYKAALFPNNLLETGNYVYLHFPDQQRFILSRMGVMFAGSAVLILVIMACFYIAISTIVQQKKLADVKNDFINNMTHEFKTPVSTISLAVEMAQEQLRTSAQTQPSTDEEVVSRLTRYMNIIRDETRRIGSHVEKVLQMALLDRGQVALKVAPVNVHDVIEKVLNTIGLQVEQRHGELELEFEANPDVIEADELHLTNILYNLVDNAIKYSSDPPHIAIRTRTVPEGVSIMVSDWGIGLTKDQIGRIFDKFYRVPTGNRHDVKGFGLGLSYVKKMVEEHHGTIRVESQPGQGSPFDVILPYHYNRPT